MKARRYKYNIAATEAICNYQGNYYFVFLEEPALCKMNREALECELLYLFNENGVCGRAYKKIIPYRNRLFLVPFTSAQIAVYDIESREMQLIPLSEEYMDIGKRQKFEDALVQGKFLYMIPGTYHALIKMDMEKLMLEEIPLDRKEIEIIYSSGSACLHNSCIVFPIYSEGSICIYNTDTNEIERKYPVGRNKKYSHILIIENELWLIPVKIYEGIDVWDIKNQMIKETLVFSGEINAMSQKSEVKDFRAVFFVGRRLYLLSCGLDSSMIIDLDSKTVDIWDLPNIYEKDEFPLYRYRIRYASVFFENDKAVICGLRGEWLECDGSKTKIIERRAVWSRDLITVFSTKLLKEVTPECELDLDDFIKMKVEMKQRNENVKMNNGLRIYKYMCRLD